MNCQTSRLKTQTMSMLFSRLLEKIPHMSRVRPTVFPWFHWTQMKGILMQATLIALLLQSFWMPMMGTTLPVAKPLTGLSVPEGAPGVFSSDPGTAAHPTPSARAMVAAVPDPVATISSKTPVTTGDTNQIASVPSQSGVTYAWSVTGGTLVAGQGTSMINYTAGPVGSCSLKCTVTNSAAIAKIGTLAVPVLSKPVVTSFTTSRTDISPGGNTILTSVFTGGTGVIDHGVGPALSGHGVTASPTITTTYWISVTNAAGSVAYAYLTVNVDSIPVVTITAASPVTTTIPSQIASVNGPQGSTYLWGIAGGTITSATTSNTVYYTPGAIGTCTLTCTVTNAAGVSATGSKTVTVIAKPVITSLTSAKSDIKPGDSTTLTPVFSGGSGVIDHGVGPVISGTGVVIAPTATTSYNLTVTNPAGTSAIQIVNVTVDLPPVATISALSPVTSGALNQNASIRPQTGCAYAWTLSPGTITSGAAASSVYFTPGPVGTAILTCKVTNPAGVSATGTATINVVAGPVISSFTANPTTITAGQNATLTPVFTGGQGLVDRGVGQVTSGAASTVTPPASGSYNLIVTNAAGTAMTQAANITVTPSVPGGITTSRIVTTGTINLATVPYDASSTYAWTVTNGTPYYGATTSSFYYTAGPVGTTTLNCIITKAGIPTTQNTTVSVIAAPVITSFVSSKSSINLGDSLTLTPTFSNGIGVLTPGVGHQMVSGTPVTVSPVVNINYFLTVTNAAGTATSSSVFITIVSPPVASVSAASPVTTGTAGAQASVPYQAGTFAWTITGGTLTQPANYYYVSYTPGSGPTCTLTCTVTNSVGISAVGSAVVSTIPPPTISSFTSSASSIKPGDPISLTPTFTNGWGVIDHAIGPVTSGAPVTATTQFGTPFILTVTNAAGTSVQASVFVYVVQAPDPTITLASPVTSDQSGTMATVPVQGNATYAWTVSNGTINAGFGSGSNCNFTPGIPGPCQLTCTVTNSVGATATGTVTVMVIPPPEIQGFTTTHSTQSAAGSTTLQGNFRNGWGVLDNGIGPVSSGFSLALAPTAPATYTLKVTNAAGTTLTQTAALYTWWITPQFPVLPTSMKQIFGTNSNLGSSLAVNWAIREPAGGTVTADGLYTAPATPGVFHLDATGKADPTLTSSSTITVSTLALVSPGSVTLKPGASQAFKVKFMGGTPQPVSWSAISGSISPQGAYTAPQTSGNDTVTATWSGGSDTAHVAISTGAPTQVAVTPSTAKVGKGGSVAFSASTSVTWTASGGTINAAGAFTAPNAFGTYTVTATSVADPTAYAEATVVVSAQAGTDKSFIYDLNGNLLDDGDRTFEWDAENRLVAVTIKATGHRSEFGYDGLGRRVEIIEKDNTVITSDKKYLWEGTEIVEERGASGGTVQKRFYLQGFVDGDGTNLFYSRDHLGSIRELTDSTQVVRARYDYDPYGRMTKIQGDRDSFLGYTGHPWHQQSGLNLTMFRAFDSNLGQWISRDPIGEFQDGSNLFRYVNGNPINNLDPDGKASMFWPKWWPWGKKVKTPDPIPKDGNPSWPYPDHPYPGDKLNNCIKVCETKLRMSGIALPACTSCCIAQEDGNVPPDKDCSTYFCKMPVPKKI